MPENEPVTPTSSEVPAPAPTNVAPEIPAPPIINNPTSSGKKKKLKLVAIIIAVVVVLLGGSAGAYYGLVVPNKPGNVLKKAIKNTVTQKKAKFTGKLSYESTDPSAEVKAVNVTLNGQSDSEKNAFQMESEVTAFGAKIPFEIRGIDKNLYFKVGDLSSVKALANLASPDAGPIVDELNKKIANQWIVVDETLLKEAGVSCSLDTSFALTNEDVDFLIKRYKEVPFASSKSSNDTVDGKPAIKYEIEVDDSKAVDYAKGLDQLSIMKKLKECNPQSDMNNDEAAKSLLDAEYPTTPFTLWVSKSDKKIVKIAIKTTPKQEEKEKVKASFEMTFQYGQAEISKPEGAKPVLEILGDFGALFGGQPTGDMGDIPTFDAELTQ